MVDRIVNYFGTFLESMKSATQRQSEPPDPTVKVSSDSLDAVLKALRGGPLSAKDLIPLTGNSAGEFLNVRERLLTLGWAQIRDGDALELTREGDEVAALLA